MNPRTGVNYLLFLFIEVDGLSRFRGNAVRVAGEQILFGNMKAKRAPMLHST
jgi:hypothetical protein